MASVDEKLAAFSTMVIEMANKQSEERKEKLSEAIDASVEKAEKDFSRNAKEDMEKEVLKRQRENNEKILKLEAELKRKLLLKREGIIGEIFNNVSEKVELFTESDDYKAWLKSKADMAVGEIGDGEYTICIMKKDEKYKSLFENIPNSKVILSDENFIGGVKVFLKNKCVDYSLKTIMEQEQGKFLQNTDLSVG